MGTQCGDRRRGDMKATSLYILGIVAALAVFTSSSDAYHVSAETSRIGNNDLQTEVSITRHKRQLEDFDNDYPSGTSQDNQEEPSFWDRIVKVALKLFSKFVEWLNS